MLEPAPPHEIQYGKTKTKGDETLSALIRGIRGQTSFRSPKSKTRNHLVGRYRLAEQTESLQKAQQAELSLRQRHRELEEKAQSLELEVARKLDAERARLAEQFRAQATDEQRLKLAEKEKLIGDLQRQIESLKQKAEQGSIQLQGVVLELDLEERLQQQFPSDRIEPVANGQRGADVLQCVLTNTGHTCGSILWEAKRARNWGREWIAKFKEDQRDAKADVAVIVSQVLPPEIRGFGFVEGVWICDPATVVPLALVLRWGLATAAVARQSEVGRQGKMESQRDEVLRQIPLRDLDRLLVAESVQVTSQALAALLRADIPVSVLGWNGQFLGGFLPAGNAHGPARLRQYRRTQEADFALQMAGRIVTAKLYNQRRVLQRVGASRKNGSDGPTMARPSAIRKVSEAADVCEAAAACSDPQSSLDSTLKWLDSLFASISRSQNIDELRGYEGAATARYFQAWAGFLPAGFPFERRSTRPPLNSVNACISFGSTLLYQEAVAFLHAHGLDAALGTLHTTEDGRWSLALDLIEPFRPVLVEALALDLFSHQILKPDHFEQRNGGVYLNDDGRRKFFLQYERRMERQFLSESVGHRTTLRQQLENQAVMFKAALEQSDRFEPFLMN